MHTPTTQPTTSSAADQSAVRAVGGPDLPAPSPGGSRRLVLIIAVVVALAAAAGFVRFALGDDAAANLDQAPLELSLGAGDGLASCLAFDVAVLSTMTPAFAGTVTAVEGETITMTVDRWYAGGDATAVVLHAPAGLEALIGGIDFQVGQQYLITAAEGSVNYCGYSGPASPEMTAAFEEAFAA